jgi:hypothetical protein
MIKILGEKTEKEEKKKKKRKREKSIITTLRRVIKNNWFQSISVHF